MRGVHRLLAAGALASAIFPCAIDTSPSFIPVQIPEKFDSAFLRGELGILTPALSEKYKLIAWRYLAGQPLDSQEQEAIVATSHDQGGFGAADGEYKAIEEWRHARQSIAPYDLSFNTGKGSQIDPGSFYVNCLPDAFTTAARTLTDRQQRYANKELLTAWVAAQDEVFKNCMANQASYPPDPDPSLPALARADRLYQIAAAHFYAEDLEGAEQRFRAIAADGTSPWRDTAAYLIARTLIRESSLLHKPDNLAMAKAQLAKIASGPLYDSAQGMIGYIDTLQDPGSALKSLSTQLAPDFAGTLPTAAYVLTSSRFADAIANPSAPEPFRWIHALESRDAAESMQGWRKSHNTLWLTAALIRAKGHDADLDPDLVAAGLKVPTDSPAFDTVMYNTIGLMIADGQAAEARRRLDGLLTGNRRTLDSVDNVFRGQRMSLATSYDDFLHWAPRRPIGYNDSDASPILASDSVAIFNDFTPLPKLLAAAESPRLPEWPRTQIAISAWTRAFVLGDGNTADQLSQVLGKTTPSWAQDLSAFRTAVGDEKPFAGALLILRHSEFFPHVYSVPPPQPNADGGYEPNWWCAEPPKRPAIAPSDAVLSAAEQTQATIEIQKIHDAGSAQAFLAPIVMSWSKSHSGDPRVPEALYRLVRVTRYGCRNGDPDNGEISKAAFDLLHQDYAENEWTKKTPYWFK